MWLGIALEHRALLYFASLPYICSIVWTSGEVMELRRLVRRIPTLLPSPMNALQCPETHAATEEMFGTLRDYFATERS